MSSARRNLQLASLGTLGFGFLTGKVIAVARGVDGVGYQSAIVGAGSLAALLCTFAIGNVLPEMAAAHQSSKAADFGKAFWTAAGLAAIPAVSLAFVLTAPELSKTFSTATVAVAVVAAALGSALLAYRAVVLSVFADGSAAARFQVISAAVTSLTMITAVLLGPIGVLPAAVGLGILAGPLVSTLATLRLIPASTDRTPISPVGLVRHSLPTYGSSLLSAGAVAIAPLIMLNLAGAAPTGMFRAVSSLGGIPATVVTPAIALHFYPSASRLIAQGKSVERMTNDSVRHLGGRAALAGVALAVAAPVALWAAYSSSFTAAAAALALVASAGGVRVVALHGAYLLLASGRRIIYLAAEALAAGVLLAGTVVAAWYASVTGAAIATWLSSAAYLIFLTIVLNRPGGAHLGTLHIPVRLAVAHLAVLVVATLWTVLPATESLWPWR